MGRMIQAGGLAVLLALIGASATFAQSASSSASQYSHGYGAGANGYAEPVNVSTRDANGNRTIVDGVIQNGNSNSIFGQLSVAGVGQSSTGASTGTSTGTATAIGNNLVVQVNGNHNTTIVNATQINNGNVTATTELNGKLNLDGAQ